MLSVFMITRARTAALLSFASVMLALAAAACQRVPLLAPSGSTITLTTGSTALPINGTADVFAQVIEPAGTPPHSGTHVSFTTTLGVIEPVEAETDINGRVQVKFLAGNVSGTATINAISGSVSTGTQSSGTSTATSGAVKIAVGTAAVGRVTVNASPATVPSTGGSTAISATVFDINGNVLSSAPVSFSTTAGTLSSTLVSTDANGVATATLTTSLQATVTASVGAQPAAGSGTGTGSGGATSSGQASGTVTVNIAAVPGLVITPPGTAPSAGLPASYTFVVSVAAQNGSAVRDLFINWGDGQSQDLGAVTGTAAVAHVYNSAGTYIITAKVTDAAGNSSTVSTAVTVIPVASPTIIITASVPTTSTPTVTVTFQVQVTPPTGVGIQSAVINFGDGQTSNLGGLNGSVSLNHNYTQKGPATVTVTVLDTLNRTTQGTTTINVP